MPRFIKSFQNDAAIQAAVDDKSLGHPYVALDDQLHRIDWNGKEEPTDYSKMYLTIEALSGGTFYVRDANIGYSVNGAAWETTTGVTELSLNQGDTVRFKGTTGGKYLFSGNTLAFNAYGNIESLEYGDNFSGATTIKNVAAFNRCFSGCTSLTDVQNLLLPATSLTNNCYNTMFGGCRSIATAPELPASIIPFQGYSSMFLNCTSLNYIKCLATDKSATNCTIGWLYNVASRGTFVKKTGVSWATGVNAIPRNWTVIEE